MIWTGSPARVQARHTTWPAGSRSRVRVPSRRRGAQATTVQPSTRGAGSYRSTNPAGRDRPGQGDLDQGGEGGLGELEQQLVQLVVAQPTDVAGQLVDLAGHATLPLRLRGWGEAFLLDAAQHRRRHIQVTGAQAGGGQPAGAGQLVGLPARDPQPLGRLGQRDQDAGVAVQHRPGRGGGGGGVGVVMRRAPPDEGRRPARGWRVGVAAMAAQGALAGQQALLGPAGDGLGGDLQDGGDFGRPQEGCDARRRPRRLLVHRDLTRCSGVPGARHRPRPRPLQGLLLAPCAGLNGPWLPRLVWVSQRTRQGNRRRAGGREGRG